MQASQLYNLNATSSNDIKDLIKSWENHLLNERRYSSNTVESYLFDVVNFIKFKSEYDAKQITLSDIKNCDVKDVRAFLADRKQHDKCNSSNGRVLSGLSSFFEFLKEMDLISDNIIKQIKRPKLEKKLPHPADLDDIIKIINSDKSKIEWIARRDSFLYVLIYATGIRISEALNLKVSDFKNDYLTILGKGRKERVIPLLNVVFEYLFPYTNVCPYITDKTLNSDELLFWGERGKKLNRTFCATLLTRLGQNIHSDSRLSPHALRHSFATHLIQNSANIRAVEEMMGHSSLATTEKYTKLLTDDLLSAYKKFHPLSKK